MRSVDASDIVSASLELVLRTSDGEELRVRLRKDREGHDADEQTTQSMHDLSSLIDDFVSDNLTA